MGRILGAALAWLVLALPLWAQTQNEAKPDVTPVLTVPVRNMPADILGPLFGENGGVELAACQAGYGECPNGKCCPLGTLCTGDGYCVRQGAIYCGGGRSCNPGSRCHPSASECYPVGAMACPGGGYCAAGSVCTGDGHCRRAAPAAADPRCTNWMQQPDGSQYRVCTDNGGRRYCEQASGGTVSRVRCE